MSTDDPPPEAASMAALRHRLQDGNYDEKSSAVASLATVASEEAAATLIEALTDDTYPPVDPFQDPMLPTPPGVGTQAEKALVGMDAAVGPLRRALRHHDVRVGVAAARILGAMGARAAPAWPDLVTLVADKTCVVRITAALVLGDLPCPDPDRLVQTFVAALEEPEEIDPPGTLRFGYLRSWIAQTIEKLRLVDERLIRPLQAAAGDSHAEVRHRVARALTVQGETDPAIAQHVDELLDTNRTFDSMQRQGEAAAALGRLGVRGVPALLRVLAETLKPPAGTGWEARAQKKDARGHVIDALQSIGPAATEAVPALLDLLRRATAVKGGPERDIGASMDAILDARNAAPALAAIGGAAVVGPLREILDGLQPGQVGVQPILSAFGQIGPEARDALPSIRPWLDRDEDYVRKAAREALEKIEPRA